MPSRGGYDRHLSGYEDLYKFCSDYSGIRHAGDPAGVRRALCTRDLTRASLLLLSFTGYLSPSVDERVALGVGFESPHLLSDNPQRIGFGRQIAIDKHPG